MSNNNFKINFMSKRKLAMVFSLLVMAVSIGSIATKGLNLGIDFTGGYLIDQVLDKISEEVRELKDAQKNKTKLL